MEGVAEEGEGGGHCECFGGGMGDGEVLVRNGEL